MAGQVVLMGGNYVVKAQPYYPPLEAGEIMKNGEGISRKIWEIGCKRCKQQEWNFIIHPELGFKNEDLSLLHKKWDSPPTDIGGSMIFHMVVYLSNRTQNVHSPGKLAGNWHRMVPPNVMFVCWFINLTD